jgi:hypothetical protein
VIRESDSSFKHWRGLSEHVGCVEVALFRRAGTDEGDLRYVATVFPARRLRLEDLGELRELGFVLRDHGCVPECSTGAEGES